MPKGQVVEGSVVPAIAAGLAAGWLAAAVWLPAALAPLTVAAVAAGFGLRPGGSRAGRVWPAVAAVAAWLTAGLAGALWLRSRPTAGLAWVVFVLFAVPLPVVPWLYARRFERPGTGDRGQGTGSDEGRE